MKPPIVSIGLPVRNGETLIQEALNSVLNQDFEEWELIISDNGSTDSTLDICRGYAERDPRIKVYPMESNIGLFANFTRVMFLASAPFFAWISHDDIREPQFLRQCLQVLMFGDQSIVMVYPTTIMRNKEGKDHLNPDKFRIDQEDPVERFRQIIWNLGPCNMLHGIFRTETLRQSRSLRKHLYRAFDNLLLAETALRGKIIQIEGVLFIRRITRHHSTDLAEKNTDLINTYDERKMLEGLTMPHVRLTYAHFELVNESDLSMEQKVYLIKEIKKCFTARFGQHMRYEIVRAMNSINAGVFFKQWDEGTTPEPEGAMLAYHINTLIKALQEAIFIFPEVRQIMQAQQICLEALRRNDENKKG